MRVYSDEGELIEDLLEHYRTAVRDLHDYVELLEEHVHEVRCKESIRDRLDNEKSRKLDSGVEAGPSLC